MSRYDIEKFEPPPDPDLVCCICQCVLDKAVESPCRHVFCQVCIERWLTNHITCPTCRKRTRKQDLKPVLPLVQNMINRLLMICDFRDHGCFEKIMLEQYDKHISSCGFEMKSCRFYKCSMRVLRMHLEEHERELCEHREMVCEGECGLMIALSDRPAHNCVTALKAHIDEKNRMIETLKTKLQELNNLSQSLNDQLENLRQQLDVQIDENRPRLLSISSLSSSDTDITDFMSDDLSQESFFDENSNSPAHSTNNDAFNDAENADRGEGNDVVEQVERTLVTSLFDLTSRLETVRTQMRAVLDAGFVNVNNDLQGSFRIPSAALDAIVNNNNNRENRDNEVNRETVNVPVSEPQTSVQSQGNQNVNSSNETGSPAREGILSVMNNLISNLDRIMQHPIRRQTGEATATATESNAGEDDNPPDTGSGYVSDASDISNGSNTPVYQPSNAAGTDTSTFSWESSDSAHSAASLATATTSVGSERRESASEYTGRSESHQHVHVIVSQPPESPSDSNLSYTSSSIPTLSSAGNSPAHHSPEHSSGWQVQVSVHSPANTEHSSFQGSPDCISHSSHHPSDYDSIASNGSPPPSSPSASSQSSQVSRHMAQQDSYCASSHSPEQLDDNDLSDWSALSSRSGRVVNNLSSPQSHRSDTNSYDDSIMTGSVSNRGSRSVSPSSAINFGSLIDIPISPYAGEEHGEPEEATSNTRDVNGHTTVNVSQDLSQIDDSTDHERDWSNTTADVSQDEDSNGWSEVGSRSAGDESHWASTSVTPEHATYWTPSPQHQDHDTVESSREPAEADVRHVLIGSSIVTQGEPDSTINIEPADSLTEASGSNGDELHFNGGLLSISDSSDSEDSQSIKYLTKRIKSKDRSTSNEVVSGSNGDRKIDNDNSSNKNRFETWINSSDNDLSHKHHNSAKQSVKVDPVFKTEPDSPKQSNGGTKRKYDSGKSSEHSPVRKSKRNKCTTSSYTKQSVTKSNYSPQHRTNVEFGQSKKPRSTTGHDCKGNSSASTDNTQSLNVRIDLSLINYSGQLMPQVTSGQSSSSSTNVQSHASISPLHSTNSINLNIRDSGIPCNRPYRPPVPLRNNSGRRNDNLSRDTNTYSFRQRHLNRSSAATTAGSSPARSAACMTPLSGAGPDLLSHWMDENGDSESDRTWEPESDAGDTDVSLTEDGEEEAVESDSSYEMLIPKSAASLLEAYASDDTDESWSVHMK